MQIESFFDLIRSRDISNVSIAWQIARGMRDDGDPDFEEFVKAVYGWALSDIPNQLPVNFLAALYNFELNCKILRKQQIPSVSKAIAPLVEKITIGDIQTDIFPRGFDVFDQLKEFSFGTQRIKKLSSELVGLNKLKKLKIESQHSFELSPGFLETQSLKSLSISSWQQLVFPDSLPKMDNLKELMLLSADVLGPIWDCHQLKSLELSDSHYTPQWDSLHEFWKKLPQLVNLENLTLRLPSGIRILPDYIYKMKNLKSLHFLPKYNDNRNYELSSAIMKMNNLQELTIYSARKNELEWLANMPGLNRLNIRSKSDFEYICEMMISYGSQAEVILVV